MKLKDIALSAAYVGQRVVKAICVGAQEVWSAVKYIVFADPVVEQICATNWGDGVGITEEQAAKVTDIGTIFNGNTEITSFEELEMFGITEIPKGAFSASSIVKVGLSDKVVTFGDTAFYECTNLVLINLPHNTTHIGNHAFRKCNLQGMTIHLENLQLLGGGVFNSTKIKRVTHLGNVSTIGTLQDGKEWGCFENCTELEEVVLPNSVKKIGGYAFSGCSKLKSINIDNVEYIGKNAFSKCSCFDELDTPKLVEIGESSFASTNVRNVSNLNAVTSIPRACFGECTELISVNLPQSVTSIGDLALYGCSKLSTIIVNPTTPPSFGNDVFWNTPLNFDIYVPDGSVQAYREASGWLSYADKILPMEAYLYGYIKFADPAVEAICLANWDTNGSGYLNKEEAKAVTDIGTVFKWNTEITSFNEFEMFTGVKSINDAFSNCSALQSIKLPEGLETIADTCFYQDTNLTEVIIPSSVRTIGRSSFHQTGIASVEIPAGVEVIGSTAFSSCKSLVDVKLPEGLKRIENYGFSYCDNLSYLDIPSTVEYIGKWCFFGNKYIAYILRPTTPPELGDTNVFQTWWGYEENYTIYVPDASVDAYKAAPNWSTYADRIKPLSQYVEPTNE